METKPKGGYGGHAGTTWQVMCAKDKSMDGMVGQVQNCYFFQTPSVIKCGISCIVLEKSCVHLDNALSM